MVYGIHPSKKINELFKVKPYQGADPNFAKIIFIGRDANWNVEIENNENFSKVVEYLEEGSTFWKKYKVHHPFKLNCFPQSTKTKGWKYHDVFSRIGLNDNFSENISFVELVGVPTFGMANDDKNGYKALLNSKTNYIHLQKIDKFLNDKSKLIFIAWGVFKDMQMIAKSKVLFQNIKNINLKNLNQFELHQYENVNIHTHFSTAISTETIQKISLKVTNKLNQTAR